MYKLPIQIRVYQTGPHKSWTVESENVEGVTNLFLFPEQDKQRAIDTGRRYADYFNVDLFVEGRKQAFKRSTDPKWFGGITRPAA